MLAHDTDAQNRLMFMHCCLATSRSRTNLLTGNTRTQKWVPACRDLGAAQFGPYGSISAVGEYWMYQVRTSCLLRLMHTSGMRLACV